MKGVFKTVMFGGEDFLSFHGFLPPDGVLQTKSYFSQLFRVDVEFKARRARAHGRKDKLSLNGTQAWRSQLQMDTPLTPASIDSLEDLYETTPEHMAQREQAVEQYCNWLSRFIGSYRGDLECPRETIGTGKIRTVTEPQW